MDFPQYADMVKLLSNPITFGILVSLIWEQTAWFKDDKISSAWKIAAVAITGLIWSIVVSFLGAGALPNTAVGWYNVLMLGVATVASTQVFHKLVTTYLPALGDLLVALRIGQTPVDIKTTISSPAPAAITTALATEVGLIG